MNTNLHIPIYPRNIKAYLVDSLLRKLENAGATLFHVINRGWCSFLGHLLHADLQALLLATKHLALLLDDTSILINDTILDIHGILACCLSAASQLASTDTGQEVLVFGDELGRTGELAGLVPSHALLVEHTLSACADLAHALHGLERFCHELGVVSYGNVAAGLEEERVVDRHLLAGPAARRLCPAKRAGVSSELEVLVALGFAESEGFS